MLDGAGPRASLSRRIQGGGRVDVWSRAEGDEVRVCVCVSECAHVCSSHQTIQATCPA